MLFERRITLNDHVLPIRMDPPILTYHFHAFPLGILFANEIDVEPWFYSNYIQLIYKPNDECRFDFLHNYFLFLDFFERQDITRYIIKKYNIPLIDFLKNAIQNGNYIYTIVNEYHIPHRNAYHSREFWHDICVYGYSDDGFYTLGYDDQRRYTSNIVSFNEFELSEPDFINLLKVKSTAQSKLDLGQIYELLNDYLYPSNRTAVYGIWTLNNDEMFYGLKAYKYFYDHFDMLRAKKVDFDVRAFRLLLEHKQIMYKRLVYLCDKNILKTGKHVLEYEAIVQQAEKIRLISVKYSIKGDDTTLQRLSENLSAMIENEKDILTEVLSALKQELGI